MKRRIVIIITLVSGAIFIGALFFSVAYSPNDEISTPSVILNLMEEENNSDNLDKYSFGLFIPTVGINTKVVEVGITKKGNIASPRSFDIAGWYKYGPQPGESGTAVIDGHVDNGLANPGVFKNLEKIIVGDHIYVEKDDKTLHFVAQEINVYDFDIKTNGIIIESETPRLLLITCTGSWIPDLRTHNQRLVVTAVLVEE